MVHKTRAFLASMTVACSGLLLCLDGSKVNAAELLMIEEDGCFWCEAWNNDISGIYSKTVEGQSAPLRRADIKSDIEQEVSLKQSVHFTPTFLLVEDGKEVARIEGYPGEDFFWGMLNQILEVLPQDIAAAAE